VTKGECLATVKDPNSKKSFDVIAIKSDHSIGHNNASSFNQWDGLFHIGLV